MNSRRTICFINTSKIWGGGESWQYETLIDFTDTQNLVLIGRRKSKLYEKAKRAGIKNFTVSTGNLSYLNPYKILKVYLLIRSIKPHTILFNTSNDFKLFALPAKWAGVSNIIYRRDNGKPLKPHFLNRLLFNTAVTNFLPCSQFISESAVSKSATLIAPQKIKVIYNSINLKNWDALPTAITDFHNKPNDIVFGCIGRISREKGQLLLPQIAKQLRTLNQNFNLVIAGTGPDLKPLQHEIHAQGIQEYVKTLGFVESNKSFIDSIDCLLLPSYWEGLPTSAIEALAQSKPVIAFDTAGNPEIVRHLETGILVKPYDTQAFAQAMELIISSQALVKSLGSTGRQLVESEFSKEVTNPQLAAYF